MITRIICTKIIFEEKKIKTLKLVKTGGQKAKLMKKPFPNTCELLNKYVGTYIIGLRIFTVRNGDMIIIQLNCREG